MKSKPTALFGFAAAMLALTMSDARAQSGSDTNIERLPDIEYAKVGDTTLMLDLYMSANRTSPPPLLVFVHGGGWRAGNRSDVSALELVEQGFALASVSYRLSPVAPFPAQIHDIKGAIRFLRKNAEAYGYDAQRIAVLGVSAGAHLAALAAVTNGSDAHEGTTGGNLETSSSVQALVSYFGASNLTSILAQSTPFGLGVRVPSLELLFGGPVEEHDDLARLASPVFFVDSTDPPMYLLHGDQDPQMPINQTHELQGAARAAGIDVQFDVVHGSGHGGPAFFEPERIRAVAEFLNEVLAEDPST